MAKEGVKTVQATSKNIETFLQKVMKELPKAQTLQLRGCPIMDVGFLDFAK